MPTDLFLSFIEQSTVDNSTEEWLERVKNKINWGVWCLGHYHADRLERPRVEQFYEYYDSLDNKWHRWHGDNEYNIGWYHKSPNYYLEDENGND
jgi:hypothetical protein